VTYGDPQLGSAMSRTVGLPMAFAVLRILKGEVRARGVRAPVDSEVYRPVLADLKAAGISMRETSACGSGMVDGLVTAINTSVRMR
jgi:hypothetical protein